MQFEVQISLFSLLILLPLSFRLKERMPHLLKHGQRQLTERIKMAQTGCHQKIILYVENIFSVEDPQLIQGKELLRHEK